jgi:CRP-like cAMP-binding protein
MGLIDGSPRSATCRAKSDVRVVQFTDQRYRQAVGAPGVLGATLRRLLCSSLSGQLTAGTARVHSLLAQIAPSEVTDDLSKENDDITREDLRQITGVLEGWELDEEGIDSIEVVETEDAKRRRTAFIRRDR